MILGALASFAQGLPLCKDAPYLPGEDIRMGIMYKWGAVNTEVAIASLSLEEVPWQEDTVYHAACQVKSAPFFDVFFKMRENFQSWFTKGEIRPLEAVRDTREGNYTATNHFVYDWEEGLIRAEVSYNGLPPEQKQIEMKGASYDIVSLIYFLRGVDWEQAKKGEPYIVPFAIDDTVFSVSVTCYGAEQIKVRKLGRRSAIRFSCSVVAGALFKGDQQLQVWFSDDGKTLPLAVMVPLKMGTMWAWLKE